MLISRLKWDAFKKQGPRGTNPPHEKYHRILRKRLGLRLRVRVKVNVNVKVRG